MGTVVVQVAATVGCQSVGIEVDDSRASLAVGYCKQFLENTKEMCLETLIDLREGRFQDPSFKELVPVSSSLCSFYYCYFLFFICFRLRVQI